MPKGKNLLEKTCHCYYQATETNACVCECKIVEEESEMRTKNPYLHTTMQKNNRFKIYEMKKKNSSNHCSMFATAAVAGFVTIT